MSLYYLVKCQTSHSSRRRQWPIAWSMLIKPDMWLPNNPNWNPVDYAVWGVSFIDGLSLLTIHDNSGALNGANRHSIWLTAPLVSEVAGFSESSSSKADILNIWCENCEMLQLLWTITEVINKFVVNFLECVVTDIALFSIVTLNTLIFH